MTTRPNQPENSGRSSTQPIDAPELLVGRTLGGRYRLEKVLNAGGMGIIFEATQISVGRKVAIKLLKPTLSRDPSLVERFQLEVEVVAQISHPNVVGLIDSGQDATGLTFLVMEFVDGKTLRQALRAGDLKLWEILEVFAQVCNGLIETHGQQIIHRDLKFDNIMVRRMRDGDIQVTLLDFGVAKLLSHDANLTAGGQVAGTPGIVAPELVDGKDPTARSDLYSLGVVLFTTLAGETPFEGDNDLELMRAHKVDPVPNLRKLVGHQVPEEVIDLTAELLLKDPDQRPSAARTVKRRLKRMARRVRKRFPDATGYIPPETRGLEKLSEDDDDFDELEEIAHIEALEAEQIGDRGWIGVLFPRPLVAPMTVVAMLSMILMILCVVLFYLVYEQLLA